MKYSNIYLWSVAVVCFFACQIDDVLFSNFFLQFSQNPYLRSVLLKTAGRVLAEASPFDAKWGIGLEGDHPHAKRRKMWPGSNLFGEVLMEVREMLANVDSDTLV